MSQPARHALESLERMHSMGFLICSYGILAAIAFVIGFLRALRIARKS